MLTILNFVFNKNRRLLYPPPFVSADSYFGSESHVWHVSKLKSKPTKKTVPSKKYQRINPKYKNLNEKVLLRIQ